MPSALEAPHAAAAANHALNSRQHAGVFTCCIPAARFQQSQRLQYPKGGMGFQTTG
eukprot:CAMPEP_0202396986 /NCGR_PEP_ID=MMETSP1128-20130828/316_1 /ASSEMBLY_ACC=CAM_ASM_000463 /TAXON_ID=3047 /ORGANISM="Dunaliella tertiolecta, Strain CCMP1320" /LENGTH=55 /DNA_ID=CAMNT_0048999859 /DNA_START=115 /DNA_END=282 /DNA_ORIENTATION=-